MKMINAITTADYLDVGAAIPAGSVDLIMTSPPYPGQKADRRSVPEWLDWFTAVSRLMYANLSANGVLALNVMFKRTGSGWYDTRLFTELVPMLEETGFNMVDIYPFLKANPAPNGFAGGNGEKCRSDSPAWEPIFLMSKATAISDYKFKPVRKPYAKSTVRRYKGTWSVRSTNSPAHPDGARQPNFLLVSQSVPKHDNRPQANGQSFNPKVPERFILQHTRPGDTVLDPFAGVGTTCRVAQINGRRFIGVELLEREAEKARLWLAETYQQTILDFARY